jgi:hypothetical protein
MSAVAIATPGIVDSLLLLWQSQPTAKKGNKNIVNIR